MIELYKVKNNLLTSKMEPEIVRLNLEGEICPYPLIITLKKFKEIEEDLRMGRKILEVITDHPPAIGTIPLEFRKKDFLVEVQQIEKAKWKITIKK